MYRSVISVVLIIRWDQALILHTVRPGNKALRSLLMMTRRDKSKGRNWLHTLYVASPGFLLSPVILIQVQSPSDMQGLKLGISTPHFSSDKARVCSDKTQVVQCLKLNLEEGAKVSQNYHVVIVLMWNLWNVTKASLCDCKNTKFSHVLHVSCGNFSMGAAWVTIGQC